MTVFLLCLLSISLLLAPVLADLTDAQVAAVKQRLAEGSQRRYLSCFASKAFPVSLRVTAGNSVQERRRFSSLTALDTRSQRPVRGFRLAIPTRRLHSTMFSPSPGTSSPSWVPQETPRSRSSQMILLETLQLLELPPFSQTGRINNPLMARTTPKRSRTSSTISIPFQGPAMVPFPITLARSNSGEMKTHFTPAPRSPLLQVRLRLHGPPIPSLLWCHGQKQDRSG